MNKVAYKDVYQFLLFAATNGAHTVQLRDDAEAWRCLQRLNRYRKLDRKENGGESFWDNWVFKRPINGCIAIEMRERFEPGAFKILDAQGNSLDEQYKEFYDGPKQGEAVFPSGVEKKKMEYTEADAMAEARRLVAKLDADEPDEIKIAREIRERDIEAARKPLNLNDGEP